MRGRKVALAVSAVAGLVMLTGCASMQGQTTGGSKQEWTDGFGRVCTAVKWGDSASIDCDFPQK
jgi:hypothetical protein